MLIMGLSSLLICLIIGCRSEYLHSRLMDSSEESSESIYPYPDDYFEPRPKPLTERFFSWAKHFSDYKGQHKQSLINQPWQHRYGHERFVNKNIRHLPKSSPSSLRPKFVVDSLSTSYDGASLSDTNPLIHFDNIKPLASYRNVPSIEPENSESSDHSDEEDESDESNENGLYLENMQTSTSE